MMKRRIKSSGLICKVNKVKKIPQPISDVKNRKSIYSLINHMGSMKVKDIIKLNIKDEYEEYDVFNAIRRWRYYFNVIHDDFFPNRVYSFYVRNKDIYIKRLK